MSQYTYFSDYDNGNGEYLEPRIWKAIKSKFEVLLNKKAFSINFPDAYDCSQTDTELFFDILKGEIPEVTSVKQIFSSIEIETGETEENFSGEEEALTKECYDLKLVMDFISFLYGNINQDRKEEFKDSINRVFQRNSLNFELKEDGRIIRTVLPLFEKKFLVNFTEKNEVLNAHLNTAYEKFKSIDFKERRMALKELWDAFEKITSSKATKQIPILIKKVINKEIQIDTALNDAHKIEEIFKYLFSDAKTESDKLKRIGNEQNIRHSNEKQIALNNSDYVDYLFYRMSATIHLLLIGLNSD